MSGNHDHAHDHEAAHESAHEGPIKTPKQLAWAVFFAFAVPILVIILLANYVSSESKDSSGSSAMDDRSVATRIQPVGSIELKDASSAGALKTGEQVFQAQCSACHGTGAMGAPKFGDAAAWGPRIKTGFESLLHSALKGKGNMTPQGGGELSDFEIARAVVYMANQGGAKFDEPKAPAAASAASN